ncbi:MAG: ribonuclease P protein component [Gammaproteobacteria bacterium]|nr:MAG: ribonuclease P protein component [Gammaproteobacteria bacterium]
MNRESRQKDDAKDGDGKPSRSFPRARRLLRTRDYARVFKNPRRSSDRYFTVLARTRTSFLPDGPNAPRLGLAIAKKQLRRAVDRNRVKRLVREYFRSEVLPIDHSPQDYVVMARSAVREASNTQLRTSLAEHFERLRRRSPSDTQGPVA